MIDRDPDVSKDGARLWETLDEQAAEAVRKHLVTLRGGAPFLSPDDADLLSRWLHDGWTAPQIIVALERAADARRKRPRRTPLSLRSARSHLGKAPHRRLRPRRASGTPRAAAASPTAHPLHTLIGALHATEDSRLHHVADLLQELPTDDVHALEARAQVLCRDALEARWAELTDWERDARLSDARASLAGLGLPPATLEASAEEIARDQLRAAFPLLSASAVREALAFVQRG